MYSSAKPSITNAQWFALHALRVIAMCLLIWTLSADEAPSSASIRVTGPAAGGHVLISFPDFLAVPDLTVATASGATPAQIAQSVVSAMNARRDQNKSVSCHAAGDILSFSLAVGGIAFTSYDTGIVQPPAVIGAQATRTEPGHMKVAWNVPAGAAYDSFYVECNGERLGGTKQGAARSITHQLRSGDVILDEDATNLRYRIVGYKNSVPSPPVVLTVPVPNPL